jgi:serine/threonine-protein kinase HipA
MTALNVYFRDRQCGLLTEDSLGQLQFRYLEWWLEEARIPVSITLPLADTPYGNEQAAPFVANLLPEGRDLRNRLEQLLHVDARHDFGLLAAIGRESAGALSFWPEDESPEDHQPKYTHLDLQDFHRWREFAHRQPFQFHGRALRLSLAGIQSKTALYFDSEGKAFVPENGAATTHIIKPRIPDCTPSTVFTEHLTMDLARAVLGEAEVPKADVWENCYRIRRFDRPRGTEGVKRLHQEDFCLALGRVPEEKYERGSPRERLLAPCFELIDRLGSQGMVAAPALERQRLLNQVIVNVLLHNPDAHLKNYALLYQDDGSVRVAPMYDCLCTHALNFDAEKTAWMQDSGPAVHARELSMQIGNAIAIDQVSPQDWEQFAIECGFTRAFVRRRVRSLAEAVSGVLPDVVGSVLDEDPNAGQAAEAVGAGVTGQIRFALAQK